MKIRGIEEIVDYLLETDKKLGVHPREPEHAPYSDGPQRSTVLRGENGTVCIVLGGGLEPVEGRSVWVALIHPDDLAAFSSGKRNSRCLIEDHKGYCLGHMPETVGGGPR